ncbi:MAG: hypothetical protein HEQ29_01600 [Dolichospermum sp. LBC05a]|jgi:hypothetical protein|nr:hypothetical protein [Dolichospermum sp. OL01]MCO5795547.1 hypothetical protein [Dolichospermum sp. OL03]MCS6280194.1 hypothetical protein [Dolichospermum sp.]QSV57246.1 MAG: hypothetical protein HEQ29_01600 [Dolichospermum sp. LBC05a]QSV62921.1 MAG: hypothetical protein HEQ26_09315 [Dolichospermum sp. DL01]
MKRRKFIQYSLIGGGSFVVNLGLYNPQPSDAIVLKGLFETLLKCAFVYFQMQTEQSYKKRQDAMLAEREFNRQQFITTGVAQVNDPQDQYKIIAVSQRQEPFARNVGFAFPRIEDNRETIATVGGPASVGMSHAAAYLKKNRYMDHSEVNTSIIPSLEGGTTYSDMRGWSDSGTFNSYPNNYSDTGVTMRYDMVKPGRGGFGIIDVSVNANELIKIPQIRVNF